MTLIWPVVLAVLFGAVLHAGWNALVKSSGDKELDTALVHFLGGAGGAAAVAAGGRAAAADVALHRARRWSCTSRYYVDAGRRLQARRPGHDLSDHARQRTAAGGAGQAS